MIPAPRPVDSIPETREQAIALLKHYDWDASELTKEHQAAIRKLYNLDEYGQVARSIEEGRDP